MNTKKGKTLSVSTGFVEKLQKMALTEEKEQKLSKLQGSKNIFTRGDFDDYKKFTELENQTIPNGVYECLRYGYYLEPKGYEAQKCKIGVRNTKQFAHYETYKIEDGFYSIIDNEVEKSYTKREFVSGNGKRKDYWRVRTYEGIQGKQNTFHNEHSKNEVEKVFNSFCDLIKFKKDFYIQSKSGENVLFTRGVLHRSGGILHIISHRIREQTRKKKVDEKTKDKIIKETVATCYLVYDAIKTVRMKKVKRGNWNVEKNGCLGIIAKDKKGKYVLSGFALYDKKNEATNAINAVIAKYGYTQGFLDVYDLVDAAFIHIHNNPEGTKLQLKKSLNLSSQNITKSLFTDWKVELRHLCDKKGLNYDSVIQKYDDKLTRYVAEEQLHQDAENVIAYKAYKDLTKSLTYSGYKLQGRTRLYGMDISIENKKGTYRKGVDSDGHKWKTLMHYDYGYIRGTVGTDSDHVDCYIGPDKNSKKVYVIHQNNPITHKYDEDKCMLCFESADAAKKAYMKQYDRPGFFGSMETLTVEQFKTFVFSKQGSKIHKSFNVEVTDITENNKNQKVEQLQKALYALYEQKPFVINHISTENDKSKRYNDVTLKINNFNKDKIEKAVHSVAMTLDTTVKTSKGEPFMFKSQEDLTNRIISQFLKTTRKLYLFIIKYFDLPEIDVMTKSTMIWKGKIIYNPETGKPLTNIEWNKFVKALDDFVNRNYKGIGDRIILSSETLGRILDRMAKYNTLKNITELKLEDIKYSGKTFDWISESVKNLKNTFGESLDRTQTTRIEVMQQSATQYISNIEDQLKNKIKQTLIDGIKNRESKTQVSQNLFNNCVGINRDFQRWADSEVQAATTKAYINEEIYNTPEETNIYFKRREIVDDNTCKKCEELNGVVVKYSKVPLTDEHIKDDFAKYAIWDGKTTGHIPETIQHPYCRGCWLRYYPMKNPIVDALSTIKEKNNNKWDKAVEQAKKEFEDKGIKNPNDKTKGYVARIREIYNEK